MWASDVTNSTRVSETDTIKKCNSYISQYITDIEYSKTE